MGKDGPGVVVAQPHGQRAQRLGLEVQVGQEEFGVHAGSFRSNMGSAASGT